jgi:hypothetical protein
MDDKDYDWAIKNMNNAISVSTTDAELGESYLLRGIAYIGKEDWEQGTADYKKAADYGSENALKTLKEANINYTPQKPSASGGSSAATKGKLTRSDGEYEGDIVNGRPHGKGKIISNGELPYVYVGDFVDGYFQGKGKITWEDGNVYEGDFVNGMPSKGKFTEADGEYVGNYVNGSKHGKGKYTYKNGNVYEGDWVNGVPVKGKFIWKEGHVYEGDFVNGKRHGKGKMTYADGRVQEGNWKDDKYEGKDYSSSSYSGSSSSSYTPSTSRSGSYAKDKRGVFLSIIFGLVGGAGSAFTISWIAKMIAGYQPISGMVFLAILAAGCIITFITWRNRKTVLFLAMMALSVIAVLVIFDVIPQDLRETKTRQALTATAAATVTANVNFRAGPSTDNDIIRTLNQGDTVTLTGETSGGWVQITHNGDTGWVSSEFLKQ